MSEQLNLFSHTIATPLGQMLTICDEKAVHLLEFADKQDLAHEVALVSQKNTITLVAGRSPATVLLEQELAAYFASTLTAFTVPLKMHGTIFQQNVWQQLLRIPHGQTQSYAQLAQAVGNPKGYRAAANANGANKIVIIIPCHRVIQSNGGIGGYNCGVEKKKQLLMHERNNL